MFATDSTLCKARVFSEDGGTTTRRRCSCLPLYHPVLAADTRHRFCLRPHAVMKPVLVFNTCILQERPKVFCCKFTRLAVRAHARAANGRAGAGKFVKSRWPTSPKLGKEKATAKAFAPPPAPRRCVGGERKRGAEIAAATAAPPPPPPL